jgi:hypothetical protein
MGIIWRGAKEVLLGLDIENRSIPPCREGLLLSGFCHENDEVLVVDNTCVDNRTLFEPEVLSRLVFVAHNADHEATWGIATGFVPGRYICTMVNDRRLLAGQEGYRFDLVSTISRNLGRAAIPVEMNKDIRSQFADCTYFTDEMILYNAADTIRLKAVYSKQLERAKRYNQQFMLHLNSLLIKPIAAAEMTGMRHDTVKWLSVAEERSKRADDLVVRLNRLAEDFGVNPGEINLTEARELGKHQSRRVKEEARLVKLDNQITVLAQAGKTHLKSYATLLTQRSRVFNWLQTSVPSDPKIAWTSPAQIIKVLQTIGCPLPMAKNKVTHVVSPGIGKDARSTWFIDNPPSSPFFEIMSVIDEYKKLIHNVTSFGIKWADQFVRGGRVFTRLDQAGTNTGRFSSGSKSKVKLYPNMQQIPKKLEYRSCFIADPGRKIGTLDFSNCEGVIMISQSGDLAMKVITEMPDQHSYLGTKAWRAVYRHRFERTGHPEWARLAEIYEMNQSTPEKKAERTAFKSSGGLFPVAYGVTAAKVAAVAKVSLEEGQIMIDAVKREVPGAIKYLDKKGVEATSTGAVIHNTRTYSRRWFSPVLDFQHYGWSYTKAQRADIEYAARNSPIQGTNSDLMKETIVVIDRWARLYKQDVRFLLTVHDEYICDFPEDRAECLLGKVAALMCRTAQKYLIPEIHMDVDARLDYFWKP